MKNLYLPLSYNAMLEQSLPASDHCSPSPKGVVFWVDDDADRTLVDMFHVLPSVCVAGWSGQCTWC